MSLTTPVLRDSDILFPGEHWFFYWKTSSSLWKMKLQNYHQGHKIFVPINWSFHSDDGENYDFAEKRPETDLAKLCEAAKECHKQIVFLLPLGPASFLANGGLPTKLARQLSIGPRGIPYGISDSEGKLNKIYSFFDGHVYNAFSRFVKKLGAFISERGIDSDIWGIDCGYVDEDGFQSFLYDRSPIYHQAFARYLKNKNQENKRQIPLSPDEEYNEHIDFYDLTKNLYLNEAQESLHSNWEGHFKVGFLGTSPNSFFKRMLNRDMNQDYAFETLESMGLDVLPSSVCLNNRLKEGVLGKLLNELIGNSYLLDKTTPLIYEDDSPSAFRPLSFFEVYDLPEKSDPHAATWADLGLWSHLQNHYSWCFKDKGREEFVWDEGVDRENKIYCFHALGLTKELFHKILKTFLSGGQVIFNRSGIETEFLRRLESFFLENDLKIEKINYLTTIHNIQLGQGRLLTFEGDILADLSEEKCEEFWGRILKTFEIQTIPLPSHEGVCFAWRSRAAMHHELNYDEIRRLGIYNPTSYKKKFKFQVPGNFNLIKIVDEVHTKFKGQSHEVEIEMLPEGSVSLDFGVFAP